jgi:hypothetical protein
MEQEKISKEEMEKYILELMEVRKVIMERLMQLELNDKQLLENDE